MMERKRKNNSFSPNTVSLSTEAHSQSSAPVLQDCLNIQTRPLHLGFQNAYQMTDCLLLVLSTRSALPVLPTTVFSRRAGLKIPAPEGTQGFDRLGDPRVTLFLDAEA
uniref:Uncharacterized protein n=1 Tax=Arundo donax TaxID=35708 RepID=A0A0A9DE55_ARUDO